MASDKREQPLVAHDENPALFKTETQDPEKPVPAVRNIDYSGAHEKTDPREIALVKKLDRWIMVSAAGPPTLEDVLTTSSPCYGACTGSTTWTGTPSP